VNCTERPGYRGVLNREQPAKFGDLQGAFGYSGSRNFYDLPDDLEMSSIPRRGRHDILRKEHSFTPSHQFWSSKDPWDNAIEGGVRSYGRATCVQAARREVHSCLLASAFARRLRLLHLFRHLRFDRVKIEARATLHRRVIDEGLEFLGH
jgi:hypothetical protein